VAAGGVSRPCDLAKALGVTKTVVFPKRGGARGGLRPSPAMEGAQLHPERLEGAAAGIFDGDNA